MANCNEWLYYDGRKAPVFYLCGYIPGAIGHDALSKKLLLFKNGSFYIRQFWLDLLLSSYQHLFANDGKEMIIRSLRHNEMDIDLNMDYKNPLGYLAFQMAKAVNCRYAKGMIHKLKVTPPLKILSRDERWDMVKDNFALSQLFRPGVYKTVWFMDDIITTGATALATWKSLLEFYPDINFKVIALGRTVRDQDYNMKSTINENYTLREEEETYFSNKLNSFGMKFDNSDTFFL